jgi:putative intracellular protease/amidase
MNKKKILIVVTSAGSYQIKAVPTGLWLSEFTHFWDEITNAGFEADVVSINGGAVPIDPESLKFLVMDKATKTHYKDEKFMQLLQHTKPLSGASATEYDAIYLTGGHGTMFDFAGNPALQKLLAEFFDSGKIVSAVCHGVCGLLNVKLKDGPSLIANRKTTGYSYAEEVFARRHNLVPFNLETEMKAEGASYNKAVLPLLPFAVQDGNLITGQNPFSTKKVAGKVIAQLKKVK